jgi:hypothetical protein
MRDVPAQRLAFRLEPDISLPGELANQELPTKLEAIQTDFETRRPEEALLRTVISPDKLRALALYGTESDPSAAFRIDLYSADGKFLRNLIPPDLNCLFPETVAWSPDGNYITFIARKGEKPTPTPTPTPPPVIDVVPMPLPSPTPSVAPAFPTIPMYSTEQVYICNRDGFDLRPLTSREGLIYFYFDWAPDSHALVAMACTESEWGVREKAYRLPAGRPRLINLDGSERLLDDDLTDVLPVWSTDSSKVASAFDQIAGQKLQVAIYDAASSKPTQARIPLYDALVKASVVYEEKQAGDKGKPTEPVTSQSNIPASFNPIVRLEWPMPERLYFQTAYVRLMPNETINTFQRWHLLNLSAQAAVLR